MRTKLITNEDMQWRVRDRVSFAIEGTSYYADVEEIFIDSADHHYEYKLELTVDWGEQ